MCVVPTPHAALAGGPAGPCSRRRLSTSQRRNVSRAMSGSRDASINIWRSESKWLDRESMAFTCLQETVSTARMTSPAALAIGYEEEWWSYLLWGHWSVGGPGGGGRRRRSTIPPG